MLEPKLMVGIKEVVSLITTIAVHSVRIDHEVEFLACAVECIKKGAFDFIKKNYKVINTVCGILLIVIGIMMATGTLGYLINLLAR